MADTNGKPEPVPVTETPEFKAAVAAAAAQVREELLGAFKAQALDGAGAGKPTGAAPVSEDLQSLFRQMAMTMAEVADQGTARKRVAPEILAQRAAAQERLNQMIEDLRRVKHELGQRPSYEQQRRFLPWYRCISLCVLNETKIFPFRQDPATKQAVPVEFAWTGEPNDAMRPINEVAKRVYVEFMASRGNVQNGPSHVEKPLWMTAAGLIVRGDAPSRRELPREMFPPEVEESPFVDDLGLAPGNDPNAEFVHVLGTVAAPARQNYQGQHPGQGNPNTTYVTPV